MGRNKEVAISCIQMDVVLSEVKTNLKHALKLIDQACLHKPDIICLPELFTTGYCLKRAAELAELIPGPTTELLSQKSKEVGCYLIAGSILEQGDNGIYNTSVIFDRAGRITAKYRKMHLFAPFGEPGHLTPGDRTVAVETEWGKVSVVICYDLRFPELFTELATAGVKIVFAAAEFPHPRLTDWQTLLMARAIDNHIYTVGVNRVGSDLRADFFGHTMIVDPLGKVVGELDDQEGVLTLKLDLA